MTETGAGFKSHHNTSLTGAFILFPDAQRDCVREKTDMTHCRAEESTFVCWSLLSLILSIIFPSPTWRTSNLSHFTRLCPDRVKVTWLR